MFIKANPLLIKTYLRKIKSDREDGSITLQKFIESINKLESEADFKFLGDSELNKEELSPLSK